MSVLLCGAEVYRERLVQVQKRGVLRVGFAYRIVLKLAVMVIKGMIPVVLPMCRARPFTGIPRRSINIEPDDG